ncbi:MAG: ABC transporter ATP-binding protein [Gammaproteobacteria bacterium]|nr:ABC transporter ATP-binding protein [Gammaproteobacteria bacterium]NIR85066.1 ABC transporter ATP-binding protein [Gammaproteobacteria bacterium]NIR88333.1 ABC transporter ATP-binding protein [Gammaproteobacteria bacterium]NIU06113.1 ABC transporter ATP-binding protein [Gammaproteobacteria bacterium]NIV73532.1 ATP-binding cassette domain-containing protein [Gammaproteobacteria bacterium]
MPEGLPGRAEKSTRTPLIALAGVEKRFGEVVAVREVSLDIEAGTFVAIMGPSGCGKTTTLRMLAGLERPTRGRIYYRGRDITGERPWRRGMPMVWQNLALFPFLDVAGNVAFGLRMAGVGRRERRARALEWLERLGIADLATRDISVLSGGQLQRVALARALVTEPDVLLLDEPLSALDAHLVVRMQEELTRLQRDLGITFIYVTHNQSEAFAMADRVVIMNEGAIQQIGEPRAVYRRPGNRFVAEFVGTNNILPGTVVSVEGTRLRARTEAGTFESDAAGNRRFSKGESIYLVVSADRVELAGEADAAQANRIQGRLVSEQFVGTVVTVYVDAGELGDFRVQLQQRAWDRLRARTGETLLASWRSEDCFAVGG